MSEQSLLLFGYPQIKINGQFIDIKSRKGLALLAYLAISRQPQSRDTLAGLLWPEYDQTRARANLRRTLFNLNRTVVSDWLVADSEMLDLDGGILSHVDVVRFEKLLVEGTAKDVETAIGLYRDDFLNGYYLSDSEPFDEWTALERARLQRMALAALEQLTTGYIVEGNWRDAIAAARRQLALDNLRESAWQQLMTALARRGRRSEALTAYAECRSVLQAELDVEPDPTTVALAETIRKGTLGGAVDETLSDIDAAPLMLETEQPKTPESDASPLVVATDNGEQVAPYRGLFAFREEDAPYFFGREEFTELLLTAVQEQSIVAVIGPSGSGKSSVVYAGLVAQLRATTDWLITSFRPGSRPFHALAGAFVPLLDPALGTTEQLVEIRRLATALEQGELTLQDVVERSLRRYAATDRILLIADQFEELYTLCTDLALRQHFLDTLLELVFIGQYQPSPIFTLVLTLRADFLGQALSHRALADAIQEFDVKLGPMTRPELSRAVTNPAHLHHTDFESGLVARILDDVGEEPGNLPLLEFSLSTLWQQRTNGQIGHDAYDAIGRIDGALTRYADQVFAALDEEEQEAAQRIFIQLVRPGEGTEDTRRIALRHELSDDDWLLVDRLADARLVVTGRDVAGHETVEVVHEALLRSWSQLRNWMESDRAFRVWQERLRAGVRQWEATNEDEGALLRGAPLVEAERQLTERNADLSQLEQRFIQASLKLQERRTAELVAETKAQERLRFRIITGLVTGLLLVFVLAIVSTWQWQRAERQRTALAEAQAGIQAERDQARTALSRQLAAQSLEILDRQLDLALLLGAQALSYAQTTDAVEALRQALAYQPELRRYIWEHQRNVNGLALSPDEQLLASVGADRTIRLWDLSTGSERQEWHLDSTPWAVAISPNSQVVVVGGSDGTIHRWDVKTDALLGPPILAHDKLITALLFSPDGDVLVSSSTDGTVKVWDPVSGEALLPALDGTQDVIRHLAISSDGRILAGATQSLESSIYLWELATGEVLPRLVIREDEIRSLVRTLQFSPDGQLLAVGDWRGKLHLFAVTALRTGRAEPLQPGLAGHASTVRTLGFAGQILTSIDDNGIQKRWNLSTRALLDESDVSQSSRFRHAVFGSNGLVATAYDGGRMILWGNPVKDIQLQGNQNATTALAFSPDGTRLVAGSDQWLYSLDPLTGEQRREPSQVDGQQLIESLAFSPDNSVLASSDNSGKIRLWNSHTLQPLGELLQAGITGKVDSHTLAISADGKILASAISPMPFSKELEVTTWDLSAVQQAKTPILNRATYVLESPAWGVSFDPNVRNLYIGLESGPVAVWDVRAGKRNDVTITGPSLPVAALAFDPLGKVLAMGGCHTGAASSEGCREGEIRLWNLESAQPLGELLVGHANGVNLVLFGPKGRTIIADDGDQKTMVWDLETRQIIREVPRPCCSEDLSLALHPHGHMLAMSAAAGNVRLLRWTDVVGSFQEQACRRANRNFTREEWAHYFGEQPYRPICPDLPVPQK